MMAKEEYTYCNAHQCPSCKQSKSSRAFDCGNHTENAQDLSFVHPPITPRAKVDELLKDGKGKFVDGVFLVRRHGKSQAIEEDLVLSVNYRDQSTHHRIKKLLDGSYTIGKGDKQWGDAPAMDAQSLLAVFKNSSLPQGWPVQLTKQIYP